MKTHKVVRISTRHELGYCSICGKPALAVLVNGKWRLCHVTQVEQLHRAGK